jgi:ParB family chromosome partitioning protein
LRALDAYYEGRQKVMAEQINVTESWLSRYLDLARLPAELMVAFAVPQDLRIKHVTAIKPLLKPEDRRQRVFTEATRLAEAQANRGVPMPVPDVIRALALAADPPRGQVPPRSQESRKRSCPKGKTAAESGGGGSQGAQAHPASAWGRHAS